MTPSNRPFKASQLSACIAIAFPLWSGAAIAQSTFEANGSYHIGASRYGVSTPASDSFTLPATAGVAGAGIATPPPVQWESYGSASAASLGDGHFGGSILTSQSYGSQAMMSSDLKLVYRDQITNTAGVAQQADFGLDIAALTFSYEYGTRYGTNRVSFAAAVYVDGSSAPIWSSTFTYDDGSRTGSLSGADIGLTVALATAPPDDCNDGSNSGCLFRSSTFGISNYQTTVALGTVAAGQTLGLRYEVDLSTETDMYGGSAGISFNDPASLGSHGPAGRLAFDAAGGNVAAVPEPETYAMMVAGLGLLAVGRRSRSRGRGR